MLVVTLCILNVLSYQVIVTVREVPVACKTCNCSHDNVFGGVLVRCSDRGLIRVPTKLSSNTTTLLFDGNALKTLQGRIFIKLRKLIRLDLSRNGLMHLAEGSFLNLSKLEELNLQSNHLTYNDSVFKYHIFKPLSTLKLLKINNNSDPSQLPTGAIYPDSSLQYLTSLQELYMDGLSTDFGPGFLKLTQLKNLTLSGSNGHCDLRVLKNTTFLRVSHVEFLDISNCLTTDTELGTFSIFKNIHSVDVSQNLGLGFTNISKALYGLRNSPIKVLKINHIYPTYGTCSHMSQKHMLYLKITSLQELHISDNGIIELEPGTLSNLPKSLEKVLARGNKFSYGIYGFELVEMSSLRYLDISFISIWHQFPWKRDVQQKMLNLNSLPLPLPPNLEKLTMSGCYAKGVFAFTAVTKNSLKSYVADHNLLSSISGPILGLEKLESVNLSHNILSSINSSLFVGIPIRNLDLSYNNLGDKFRKGNSGQLFQHLTLLQHFNLSANRINILPGQIFKELRQLQTLVVTQNDIEYFDVRVRHMGNLVYLDLESNMLQTLTVNFRDDLGQLPNVTVNLKGNPLSCTCLNMDFLKWVCNNRLKLQKLEGTHCILSSGKSIFLTDLDTVISDLEYQCRPYGFILLALVSLFILIMIIICLATGYRYRWKLRRLYYVGWTNRRQVIENEQELYKYDAFVSYADSDRGFMKNVMILELEEKAGLKLCVHDRDFISGTVIASNIANAIQNSRKTLIILSPSFLKSDWCQFEYNIARAEGVSRRKNIVVAVLYRPVDCKDMPRDMVLLFAQYSYLQYDMDGQDDEIFWQNISDAIGTPELTDE